MIGTELNELETKVDNFIKSYQHLALENISLSKKMAALTCERTTLLDKRKKVAQILKQVITELRDELLCQRQK